MSTSLGPFARSFRERVERHGSLRGLSYPWWVPALSALAQVVGSVFALDQRDALWPLRPLSLVVVAIAATCVVHYVGMPLDRSWLTFVLAGGAVVWLLTVPVTGEQTIDIAPGILAIVVAELTVDHGTRVGVLSAVLSLVALLLTGNVDAVVGPFYVGEIAFGLVLGVMLRWQMRALAAERIAREEEHERATLGERQRVAREIHDLVAHSMSVTMLHVTGARRALTQDRDEEAVDEAVDALSEAERIGRQAMADIRRTVGVLRTGSGTLRPLPGLADLPALLDDVRAAGMSVEWQQDGDGTHVSSAVGLALYRVMQEGLANVSRHAPGSPVRARLEVSDQAARLEVTNPLPAGQPRPRAAGPSGSGLNGMHDRIGQLGGEVQAGRVDGGWRVAVVLPLMPVPEAGAETVVPA